MATIYKLDEYRSECNIEPFILDTGETQIVIPAPTGETLLLISETPLMDARNLLTLITGDQAEVIWALFSKEQGTLLIRLLQDLSTHFKVTSIAEAPGGPVALPR